VNKATFITIIFFTPMVIYAKGYKGDFKVSLEYQTQLKYGQSLFLERKNKKIAKNGITLSPQKIIRGQKPMSYLLLSDPPKAKKEQCFAGTYKLKTQKGSTLKHESGCLESQRFKTLIQAFKAI